MHWLKNWIRFLSKILYSATLTNWSCVDNFCVIFNWAMEKYKTFIIGIRSGYKLFFCLRKLDCMLNYFILYNSYSATHSWPLCVFLPSNAEKNGVHKNMNDYEKRVLNSIGLIPKLHDSFFCYLVIIPIFE